MSTDEILWDFTGWKLKNTTSDSRTSYEPVWYTGYWNTEDPYGSSYWVGARGSAKSNVEYIVDQILSIDKPNKNRTTFAQKVQSKSPKLPDSYPKGDLSSLLGIGDTEK